VSETDGETPKTVISVLVTRLGTWRLRLVLLVVAMSVMEPIFDRNASHFGWGAIPLLVWIGVFYLLAPVIFLDAVFFLFLGMIEALQSRPIPWATILLRLALHTILVAWWIVFFLLARS
jgi:hypothetical protein